MRRSIDSENLVVVTAIAIAISLLASACGPGTMKSLKTRTGQKIFSDKVAVPVDFEENLTGQEKIEQAVQEKRDKDGDVVVDSKSVQELASRLQFVQYYQVDDGSNVVRVSLQRNQKVYALMFTDGKLDEEKNRIIYTKNAVQELDENGKLMDGAVKLSDVSYRAQVEQPREDLFIVSLFEKVTDDKKVSKETEVSTLIKLGEATAEVNSKEENILKIKDAKISTRTSQVYFADENGDAINLDSSANRIVITAWDGKTRHIEFLSVLDSKSNKSKVVVNDVNKAIQNTLNNATHEITLDSGVAVILAEKFSLILKNKKSSEESSILFTLSKQSTDAAEDSSKDEKAEAEEAQGSEDDQDGKTSEQPTAAAVDDADGAFAIRDGSAPAKTDAKQTEAKAESKKAEAKKVEVKKIDQKAAQKPIAKAVAPKKQAAKPNFSNVTGMVRSTETIPWTVNNVVSVNKNQVKNIDQAYNAMSPTTALKTTFSAAKATVQAPAGSKLKAGTKVLQDANTKARNAMGRVVEGTKQNVGMVVNAYQTAGKAAVKAVTPAKVEKPAPKKK